MASKNIVLKGTTYNGVESIELPQSGGGDVLFTEVSDTTATASDVASGKYFYAADGTKTAGTASGGGGGAYAWLGDGAEKVGTVINRTINLQNDTGYDSWTASTTATVLIPADTDPYYSVSCNLTDYDYAFVTKGYIEPVYVSGTPMTNTTKRVCQYSLYYAYGYPNSQQTATVQNDTAGNCGNYLSTTNFFIQYYYNDSGVTTARSATQCGPLYMSTHPAITFGTVSAGAATFTYKFPAFNAKCDTSRFTTERKAQVDSANTNYTVTVDLYRVPHGNGLASHLVSEMCAVLNAV